LPDVESKDNKYINVYDKYILNKSEKSFQKDPYYVIYNKNNDKFTFLNADKKILY
jgi:hypothetical protein